MTRYLLRLVPLLLLLAACSSDPTPQTSPQLGPLTPNPLTLNAPTGQVAAGTLSFQNTGNAPLTYTATASDWLTLNPASGTVPPGGSATLGLQVNCSSAGTFNGFVTVSSNASNGAQSGAVQLTCTAAPPPQPPQGGYNIEVRTSGTGFTPARVEAFTTAASVWGTYITGDVTDISGDAGYNAKEVCNFDDTTPVVQIDDLLIFARIGPIDGAGGILGQAGPRIVRRGTTPNEENLPIIGCMEFDEADVAQLEAAGQFDETILHEMGHVVGVGTIWELKGLLAYNGTNCVDTAQNPQFTGAGAAAEYEQLGGSGAVPVEDQGGPGTKCGHWREGVFDNELMTGFLNDNSINPFSRMTIASLRDLGYTVDVSQGEPYSLPACSPNCGNLRVQSLTAHAEMLEPTHTLTPDGTLSPIARDNEE